MGAGKSTSPSIPTADPRPRAPLRFGPFVLDPAEKTLLKHGLRLKLEGHPFAVLCRLAESPGVLVSRDELQRELWSEDTYVDFDHGLNEAVTKLRGALGDRRSDPRFIETVRGHGYRFVAPVQTFDRAPSVAPVRARARAGWLGWAAVAGGTLAFAAWMLWGRGETAATPVRSLAVLPLANVSADPANEYFAEGMTDELIAMLSRIQQLRVISRTSIRRYRAVSKPMPEIARELNVDALVEGSVHLEGDRVRIHVQLFDARSERSLWSETYERRASHVLAMQSEVARAIASEVQVGLTVDDVARLGSPRAVNPEAHRAYLKGRFQWNKRTETGFLRALEAFSEAVDIEPEYAPAYAGLADIYTMLSVYNLQRPSRSMPKAKQAAEKALALDDRLADAHASLGCIHLLYDWDLQAAESELSRAIELNPGYATAYQWLGVLRVADERMEEAEAALRRALELDPLAMSINENLGWAFYTARRYDEAIEQFERTLELEPRYGQALRYLGLTYLGRGDRARALEAFGRAREAFEGEPEVEADLALAYALAGHREEAEEVLRTLESSAGQRYVSPFLIASFHARLGETEDALLWLEKSREERVANLVFLHVDPLFDGLRADPRFRELAGAVLSAGAAGREGALP